VRLTALLGRDLVLSHEDVEPIALFPVTSSNGEVVFQQLEDAIDKTGVPREILADQGSDLKAGIRRFCHKHTHTCSIDDIKHKSATLLKHTLQHDEHWQAFTQKAAQSKSQIQQTALAFLAPPNQRTKARYMNLEILVRWGQRALGVLDRLEQRADRRASHETIKAKLGWLSAFRDPLKEWEALLDVAITTECFVRKHGLWRGCEGELANRLNPCAASPRVRQLREQLLAFVENESLKAQPNERLLGSSEIIESVLGKLKRLEQNQAKSGFTGMILTATAAVSKTTQEVVQKAMETVPTKKVLDWIRAHLGPSVQSKRKIAFSKTKSSEQIWDQLFDGL
jgi:transposase InsO family protein